MNRGIYATATGMVASQQWMDVIANNLANASARGFKRDEIGFDEAFLRQVGVNSGKVGDLGGGPVAQRTITVFDQGQIETTGNPFDLALLGKDGMFAVRVGNQTRYTRDGSFTLSSDRTLVNQSGYAVLDAGGQPIQIPEGKVSIGEDGNIAVDGQAIGQIGVFESNPGAEPGFAKIGGNLFAATRPTRASTTTIRAGALENSNVDPVAGMVQMIALSRAFEMAQKSTVSQDELTQRLIQSLQDR